MAYTILIVDDEPALRTMIRSFLTQAGYQPCEAGTCAEALAVFQSAQPDAVLLDVMLPDGDGFTLFAQLRALRDGTDLAPAVQVLHDTTTALNRLETNAEPAFILGALLIEMARHSRQ